MSSKKGKAIDQQQQQVSTSSHDPNAQNFPGYTQGGFGHPTSGQAQQLSTSHSLPDANTIMELQKQVHNLTQQLAETSSEFASFKVNSRSSGDFTFNTSFAPQDSFSAFSVMDVDPIRPKESVTSFTNRITECTQSLRVPEAVQREILFKKVAPRYDLPLLFGSNLKPSDAVQILETLGDRTRDKNSILQSFMSLELNSKFGCRKFCEQHAKLAMKRRPIQNSRTWMTSSSLGSSATRSVHKRVRPFSRKTKQRPHTTSSFCASTTLVCCSRNLPDPSERTVAEAVAIVPDIKVRTISVNLLNPKVRVTVMTRDPRTRVLSDRVEGELGVVVALANAPSTKDRRGPDQ